MKILFQASEYSLKYQYYSAEEILKTNPKFEIGFLIKKNIDKLLPNSKNFFFNRFIIPDILNFKPKGIVNFKLLEEFEDKIEDASIWSIISSDRQLGGSFSHGSIGYGIPFSKNRELLLEFFCYLINSYRKIFNEFKPTIFVPAIAMSNVSVKILEVICLEQGVKYCLPETLRIQNYCSISSTSQLKFHKIENNYKKIYENNNYNFSSSTYDLYKSLTNQIYPKNYFDDNLNKKALSEYKFNNYVFNVLFISFIFFLKISLDIFRFIKNIFQFIFFRKYIVNSNFNIFRKLYFRYRLSLQKIVLGFPNYYNKFLKNDKYIYYPLMSQPEYSVNILSNLYMNQLNLIETISKNLPSDWYLYVKEHPATLNDRLRPKNYFKDIKKYPNVKLINTSIDSNILIQNSNIVICSSGTTGWQTILNRKPLIELRENIWTILNLSTVCYNIYDFKKYFKKELIRHKKDKKEEYKNKLLSYLESIKMNSFTLTYPEVFFYDKVGTKKEFKKCGIEFAKFLLKYLNR